MPLSRLWEFLHLVFAFSFVGSLVVAEWNGRAARATSDWSQRAALFQIVHLSSRVAGTGSLFVSGLLGHVVAVSAGYSMAHDPWMWIVTGVWLVALLVMALISVPLSAKLADHARLAAAGADAPEYPSTLARWRFSNVLSSVLYLTLLALMVWPWHS